LAVPESGLGESRGNPNAAQKSAAGIVERRPEGPNGGRDVGVNLTDEKRQKTQLDWPVRTSERVKPGRLSDRAESPLAKHELADLVERRLSASPLNRRVRTRMHGGVGGGGP
jgi:hypothetical protein